MSVLDWHTALRVNKIKKNMDAKSTSSVTVGAMFISEETVTLQKTSHTL